MGTGDRWVGGVEYGRAWTNSSICCKHTTDGLDCYYYYCYPTELCSMAFLTNIHMRLSLTAFPPKHIGYASVTSWKAQVYDSVDCPSWITTARGRAPALVADSRRVTVDWLASQLLVESQTICSVEVRSCCTLAITGVTTSTAQCWLSAEYFMRTSKPAQYRQPTTDAHCTKRQYSNTSNCASIICLEISSRHIWNWKRRVSEPHMRSH